MRSQASCEDLYAVTDLLGDGVGTLSSVVWPLARSHMLRNKPSKTHWVIEKSKKKKGDCGKRGGRCRSGEANRTEEEQSSFYTRVCMHGNVTMKLTD